MLAGHGDVSSPGRREPGHHTRSDLLQSPLLTLFQAVVAAAQRSQIAFACDAAIVVGDGVIEVAAGGGAAAAVVAAGGGASPDDPLQRRAGPVLRLLCPVVATPSGERLGGHRDLPSVALAAGAASGGAAIAECPPGGAGDGDVPAGGAVPGRSAGQRTSGTGIQRPVSSGFPRRVAKPEKCGQRHGEIDRPGHRRHPRGARFWRTGGGDSGKQVSGWLGGGDSGKQVSGGLGGVVAEQLGQVGVGTQQVHVCGGAELAPGVGNPSSRLLAASTPAAGRLRPARLAVPHGSGQQSTLACLTASSRWRRAASGSAASTARSSARRSCPQVMSGALGSTLVTTALACSSVSPNVAWANCRALGRSIQPAASSARTGASRPAISTARPASRRAVSGVSVRAAAISSGTNSLSCAGNASPGEAGGVPSAGRRRARAATASISRAAAHDDSRRQALITPISSSSVTAPSWA